MQIEEISINSEKYPKKLKKIYNPPSKLYIIGNKEIINQKGIAIVGSRKATNYGKKVTLEIAKKLSQKGINIISGLAIGVDSYAHIGCIQANSKGKTIAILGSGIDKIYPKENIELARKIVRTGGCIISEYPCRSWTTKITFPRKK